MSRNPKWSAHFGQTVSSIASSFNNEFPESIDRAELEAIGERINKLWLDPDATWEDFQAAVGEYKMFYWKIRKGQDYGPRKIIVKESTPRT
jgi:hypothetical protein